MKFKKEFLMNELDLPWSAIENNIVDSSRWSISYEIVFKHEEKYYSAYYSVGATESQDESPWEYEDEVECTEVEQKEIVIKQWVAVE